VDIIVVATHKRKSLVISHLSGLDYKISYSKDHNLPDGFKSEVIGLVMPTCHLGHIRCFKGHQEALSKVEDDYALILEDDAIPNVGTWVQKIYDAITLLQRFDIVSFHGRSYQKELFKPVIENPEYLEPINPPIWIVAALAYLVKKETAEKLLLHQYNGKPWDILLYQHYSYCVLENSIFDHNRSEGSLLE